MAQLGFVAGASAHQSKPHNTAQRERSPGRTHTFAAVELRRGCTVDHPQIRGKKKEGRGGVGVYALQIEPSRSDAHSVDGNKNFT